MTISTEDRATLAALSNEPHTVRNVVQDAAAAAHTVIVNSGMCARITDPPRPKISPVKLEILK